MSRAAAVVRKSQGGEDDVSLELQREKVPALANELASEVETIDLGVHTGFSIHMKPSESERIDTNPQILELLGDLRAGEYDYLVAWDDTRLARDQFYWELERAARLGGCELEFVQERPGDDLTFRVQRAVESQVKWNEIEKSRQAIEKRTEMGFDHGRPPFGLKYDDAGQHWIPDRENGEYETAIEVIQLREKGKSWRDIADEADVSRSTARGIYDRRERYLEYGSLQSVAD